MRKPWILALASLLAIGVTDCAGAAVVAIGGPGITLTYRQPVQAVIVDANGTNLQQTVYYDPAIGGVDLDTSWAGPNASVYFPAYQTGYIWYNGNWVDHAGFYWNGRERIYIGHPNWGDHWSGYWHNHWHEGYHGGWHAHPEVSVHVHETIHETVHDHGHHHH